MGGEEDECGCRAPASGVGGTASVQRTYPKGMLRQVSKPCPKESGKGIPPRGWSRAGRRLGGHTVWGTRRGWYPRFTAVPDKTEPHWGPPGVVLLS